MSNSPPPPRSLKIIIHVQCTTYTKNKNKLRDRYVCNLMVCSKKRGNMIFSKPAVRCTLLMV